MNKWIIITALLAIALTSCHQLSQRAEAEQSTDRTKVVTSADALRLVITDNHLSQTDSLIRWTLKLPLDSIVVEMINNTDSKTELSMPLTILATNSPHIIAACSPSTSSQINTTSSVDGNTVSSKNFPNPDRAIPKASIAILQ